MLMFIFMCLLSMFVVGLVLRWERGVEIVGDEELDVGYEKSVVGTQVRGFTFLGQCVRVFEIALFFILSDKAGRYHNIA
jgi:hypothetical protein